MALRPPSKEMGQRGRSGRPSILSSTNAPTHGECVNDEVTSDNAEHDPRFGLFRIGIIAPDRIEAVYVPFCTCRAPLVNPARRPFVPSGRTGRVRQGGKRRVDRTDKAPPRCCQSRCHGDEMFPIVGGGRLIGRAPTLPRAVDTSIGRSIDPWIGPCPQSASRVLANSSTS